MTSCLNLKWQSRTSETIYVGLMMQVLRVMVTSLKVAKFKIHRSIWVCACVMHMHRYVCVSNICVSLYKMEHIFIKMEQEILPWLNPESSLWTSLPIILHCSWLTSSVAIIINILPCLSFFLVIAEVNVAGCALSGDRITHTICFLLEQA